MKLKSTRLCLLLALGILTIGAVSAGYVEDGEEWNEHLVNGDFSQGSDKWTVHTPPGSEGEVSVDQDRAYHDRATLRMEVASDSRQLSVYQTIPVSGGRLYEVNIVYDMEASQGLADAGIQIRLAFIRKGGKNGSAGMVQMAVPGTEAEAWKTFRQFVYIPEEAELCQFVVTAAGGGRRIWLADLSFKDEGSYTIEPATFPLEANDTMEGKATWADAKALRGFWQVGKGEAPASRSTEVKISYDKTCLYFAMVNDEPYLSEVKKTATARDDRHVHLDDCNEVFIAAPGGVVRQFATSVGGVQWDATLYQKAEGDPFRPDVKWNGKWKSTVAMGDGTWTSYWAIPWADLGVEPAPGLRLKVNFARQRLAGEREVSQWTYSEGNLNTVEKFAQLQLLDGSAVLTRFVEPIQSTPLSIKRTKTRYHELLSDQPGGYIMGDWAYAYYLASYPEAYRKQQDQSTWRDEQVRLLAEMGEHGLFGPAMPWAAQVGWDELEKANRQWGIKFPFFLGLSSASRIAKENGARLICPRNGYVSDIDPAKQKAMEGFLRDYFKKNPQAKPLLLAVKGTDEPTNVMFTTFSRTLHPGDSPVLDEVEKEILSTVSNGKYGLYDYFDSAAASAPETPFKRIAFNRWWSRKMRDAAKEIRGFVKEMAPEVPFQAFQHNAVSGMTQGDLYLMSRETDWTSVDPYPTATLRFYGRARALYHTGFSTKFASDLSGGKTVQTILQGFEYHGRAPSRENVREWASQALKNGAKILNWYTMGPSRHTIPETYQEMLAISRQVHEMKALSLPEKTRTAIIFSMSSQAGLDDPVLHACYSVYVLLGEKAGSWFRFVSETRLAEEENALDQQDLLYLPQASYFSGIAANRILKRVERGATLVIFDPNAFFTADDGTELTEVHARLIGVKPGKRVDVGAIKLKPGGVPGIEEDLELPLTPASNLSSFAGIVAYAIEPPAGSTVIASYPNGSPAAFSRKVGKGTVYYFAAQPFGNSGLAAVDSGWPVVFRALAREKGEAVDLPIWSFYLEQSQ